MKASVVIEFLTKGLDKAKAGERSLRDFGRAADGAEREASGLARAEERIAAAGSRIAQGQTRAATSMHRSTEAMRRQKAEAVSLANQQDRLFRKSQQQARASAAAATAGMASMRGVGAAFIGGLGLGVGGAAGAGLLAKETVQLAARVEYERDQLQVLGEYSDEKAKLYDKILKPAGARRGVGTMGAYGVFGELMAGGLSAENSAAMTDSVLTFAKATRAETQDAGKTAVALQNNMKVGAGEMMDAFDAMALAGKEGQFEVRDMARNAPSIFAKMAKLGESGLQGVRGFAAMAQEIRATAGTSDEAATNFENMLDKMTAGDFVKNAKKMGIDVQKVFASANKRGVSPVLEMLKKIRDVTKGDTFKLKELMPDIQANAALSSLVNKIPELEAAIGRYGNAGGTVMRDFTTATDNATEAWNRFSSNVQNQAENIGSNVLPLITEGMNRLSKSMEDIEARRAAVAGEDPQLVDNSRDEFLDRYRKINPNAGPMDSSYFYEEALKRKGRGEIPTIMSFLDEMESRKRSRELYSEGKTQTSTGRHTQPFLGITTGKIPVPGARAENLPAEPGSARWLKERYGHGTGREYVEGAKERAGKWGRQNRRAMLRNALPSDLGMNNTGGILDALTNSGPVRGGGGDGFAKGVEEGGKKAERAMETSARNVEQIASSVDTYAAGLKAGNQYAAGLEASAGSVAAAANKALVNPVANRVPQSPAKIGPLRNLPSMGRKIAQQLAGGMEGEQSPARAAAGIARRIAANSAGTGKDAGGGTAAATSRQVAGIQIGQISISGVKDAADAADSIGIELERRLAGTLADVG